MNRTARVRTLDLETTDFPPEADVIELGFVDTLLEQDDEGTWDVWFSNSMEFQSLFKPERPISTQARATHHILDEMLTNADPHTKMLEHAVSPEVDIYCAHVANFEQNFIQIPEGKYWIDTYKVSLVAYPEFAQHTNQYLRYALNLQLDFSKSHPPHRAFPDAYVTNAILCSMIKARVMSLKEMIRISYEPPFLTRIGFGEHFGKKFTEIPTGYLQWVVRTGMDDKPGVKEAAQRALAERLA